MKHLYNMFLECFFVLFLFLWISWFIFISSYRSDFMISFSSKRRSLRSGAQPFIHLQSDRWKVNVDKMACPTDQISQG